MLERLTGKLLSRFLSKYFIFPGESDTDVDKENSTNASTCNNPSKTQLAVWSGFLSLENLRLRSSLVNDHFQKKGLPFELSSGFIQTVEITVPWAQLRSLLAGGGGGAKNRNGAKESAAAAAPEAEIIVVLDGVYLLLNTRYEFYDDKLRESQKLQRKKDLDAAVSYVSDYECSASKSFSFYFKSYVKNCLLSETFLNDLFDNVANRIQIHVRNVHVRLEDLESDPSRPCCFGMTLESMHLTSEPEDDASASLGAHKNHNDVVDKPSGKKGEDHRMETILARKVIQIHQFTIYCNGMHGSDIHEPMHASTRLSTNSNSCAPPEVLPLQSMSDQPRLLSHAMHAGIVRRRPRSFNSRNVSNGPRHTYLLYPFNATSQVVLSKPIKVNENWNDRAILRAEINVAKFQLGVDSSMLGHVVCFHARLKHHKSLIRHRFHRPTVPITSNPRQWWKYIVRVVRKELQEASKVTRGLRWSWVRWYDRMELRKRYMGLYERWLDYGVVEQGELMNSGDDDANSFLYASSHGDAENEKHLTVKELEEMRAIEDATIDDEVSVSDILIFRAMVHSKRQKQVPSAIKQSNERVLDSGYSLTRFLRRVMKSEDSDEEYTRMLNYLEMKEKDDAATRKQLELKNNGKCESDSSALAVVLSVETVISKGSLLLLSKRSASEPQVCVVDISLIFIQSKLSVLENFDSIIIESFVQDCVGLEHRSDGLCNIVFSRSLDCARGNESDKDLNSFVDADQLLLPVDLDGDDAIENSPAVFKHESPLLRLHLVHRPPGVEKYDASLSATLEKIHISLNSKSNWPHRCKEVFSLSACNRVEASFDGKAFWEELSIAYINDWKSSKKSLAAKVERTLQNQRKLDIDIAINSPLISISDGDGTTISIDLGHAHLATEQLAGVARFGEIHQMGSPNKSDSSVKSVRRHMRNLTKSDDTFNSQRKDYLFASNVQEHGLPSFLSPVFSGTSESPNDAYSWNETFSAISIESDQRRKHSRPVGNSKLFSVAEDEEYSTTVDAEAQAAQRELMKCFYDYFRLKVGGILVSITNSKMTTHVFKGPGIEAQIAKSTIPSDYSLCKFRVSCFVDHVQFNVSKYCLSTLDTLFRNMKYVSANNTAADRMKYGGSHVFPAIGIQEPSISDDESSFDEDEFFDAISDYHPDDAKEWFNQQWVLDEESVGDIDTFARNTTRRRFPSTSEVSAGNMSKLDGTSESPTSRDDNDSFHSTISLDNQDELVNAIQEDIQRCKEDIELVKGKIRKKVDNENWRKGLENDFKHSRFRTRKLKCHLLRLEAELLALKSLYHEIVIELPACSQIEQEGVVEDRDPHSIAQKEALHRASALIMARKICASHTSPPTTVSDHHCLSRLNRDLLFMSFTLSSITLNVLKDTTTFSGCEKAEHPLAFLLCDHLCFSTHHRQIDTRLKFCLDRISIASLGAGTACQCGYLDDTAFVRQSPVKIIEERCLCIATELQRQSKQTSMQSPKVKIKLNFGPIELVPHALVDAMSLLKTLKVDQNSKNQAPKPQNYTSDAVSKLARLVMGSSDVEAFEIQRSTDFDLQFKLVTFCLKNDDSLSLMTCTGINVRLARRVSPISLLKTRGQLDMSVSNFQVHQIAKNDEVCELIGCQNSFDQLISARIRVQLSRRESSGGWCIGNECDEFTGEFICLENRDARRSLCWNLHVGIKCQSTVVLIFSPDLCRMARNSEAVVDSVKGLMSGLKSSDSDNVTAFDPSAAVLQKEIRREVHPKLAPAWDNDDRHDFSEVNTAIRWRVDHSMLEAIIILPGKHFRCSSGKLYDSACLRFSNSVRLCLQPDLLKSGNISIELLLRSYVVFSTPSKDELNLLEPITLSLSVYATPKLLKLTSSSMKLGAVDVPSTWAIGSPTMNTTPRDGFDMSIYVETSRLIFNVSPTLLVFVKEVNQIHKHKSHRNGSSQPSPSCTSSRMKLILSSQVTVPAVSVTLLDAPGSNVALPSYKSLFLSESISISVVSNAHRTFFSLSTGGAGIFYAKGSLIPVFYTTPIQSDCDDNAGEKFHLSTTLSKSDTSVELMLNIGASYFVVIPSFIEQSTRFCSIIISGHKKTIVPNQRERILTMTRLDWCPSSFNISCDEVNLVLPSQDVSSFCKGKDSLLNTIRLRWKPRVNATLIFKRAGAREVQPLHKIASFDTQSTDETNFACADSDRELDALKERCNERCAYADSSLVALKVDCKADFSLTRTGLILQSFEVSDSKHHWLPVIFESVYEQLIITPFAFKFVASLVICNMLAPESDFENSMDSIFCSLGLHLDVGDVDILWHVAKSRFGFSDAFSLSVRPLLLREQSKLHAVSSKRSNLDSFTIQVTSPIQHTSSSSSIESTTGHIKIPEKIYFFLKDTQIISSVRIASIQVVCVPSNAKETTSPIVKAKLATLRVGASVLKCPYPGGATIPSDRISDSTKSYLYFSSWTDFNLSAHYHNRRLVIWEPLVETWAANMQGSVNLSDVFGMNPFNTEAREATAGTTVSDRVRLIRFLEGIKQLRKSESKKEPDKKERVETYLFALTDGLNLCHFIQALVIPECLELANHPTAPQSFSHFTPVHRLETHYCNDHVSAMFSISNGKADQLRSKSNTVSVPLNINLTGALIENGIGFMLSEKSKSRSHISSHYIRNQTGSTLRWKDDSLHTCQESCGEIVPGGSEVLCLQGFPRRTYISLEMYNTSESLHFKAIRVNVDLVGTKRHVLKCPGNQKRANYVVVRVQLLDGAKVVSIESPVWIFNTSTLPFQLAMKENGKEIWHTLVLPRSSGDRSDIPRNAMPIPVHLVAKVISEIVSWELSVTSDINVLQKQPPSVEVPFLFPEGITETRTS